MYKFINFPGEAISFLQKLFDATFNLGYAPDIWKIAKIRVLKKKYSDLDNPASYRPISILNTTGRILERIINERLTSWTKKNHSTQDNIFKIIETVKMGFKSLKNALQYYST